MQDTATIGCLFKPNTLSRGSCWAGWVMIKTDKEGIGYYQ